MVSMWSNALERCSPTQLLRVASALPDAQAQERALDAAAQLLKSNELDENCSLDGECGQEDVCVIFVYILCCTRYIKLYVFGMKTDFFIFYFVDFF